MWYEYVGLSVLSSESLAAVSLCVVCFPRVYVYGGGTVGRSVGRLVGSVCAIFFS